MGKKKIEIKQEDKAPANGDQEETGVLENAEDENPQDGVAPDEVDKDRDGNKENKDDPVAELERRVDDAIKEKNAVNDRLLRVAAEFDNYKKRMDRQWVDFKKYANESLVRELLSAVDNLERAVAAASGEDSKDSPLVSGVKMTLKEIQRILEKFGVVPIDAVGKPFDPGLHEAVARKESDEFEENIVSEEYQKGYMIHDRLLRPSMVVVSSGKKESREEKNGNEQ